MHTKVETGSSTIFRFDNVMDVNLCNTICEKGLALKQNKSINPAVILPWKDNETMSSLLRTDRDIHIGVKKYQELIKNLVDEMYNVNSYAVFTDLVMWRTGRKMLRHKDNGYEGPAEDKFRNRKISTVLYLNDNYTGGETFIKSAPGVDYISKPKQGTVVTFLSDERNEHGVNEITSGIRFTLPIWFGYNS